MKNRIAWTEDGLLFVIRKGKTTNAKISDGTKPIVQTYTFDMRQYELANCGRKITPSEFFALDIKELLGLSAERESEQWCGQMLHAQVYAVQRIPFDAAQHPQNGFHPT